MKAKRISFGVIEVLGYAGILIWVGVMFLRSSNILSGNPLIGILPNVGAAWVFTMFLEWLARYALKRDYTYKTHLFVCIGVFLLAILSEVIHASFLNSPFDTRDILATLLAQVIMYLAPCVQKGRKFTLTAHPLQKETNDR